MCYLLSVFVHMRFNFDAFTRHMQEYNNYSNGHLKYSKWIVLAILKVPLMTRVTIMDFKSLIWIQERNVNILLGIYFPRISKILSISY